MSSNRIRQFTRSVGFQLNIWYSGLFIVSALLLLVGVFWMMDAILESKDHEVLESQLQEYETAYLVGGVEFVERVFDARAGSKGKSFLMLIGRRGQKMFANVPPDWVEIEYSGWRSLGIIYKQERLRIPPEESKKLAKELMVVTSTLPDGSQLQFGAPTQSSEIMTTAIRRSLLGIVLPIVFFGFAIGAFLSHRALKPVRQIIRTVESISATSDFSARVPPNSANDELADLGRLFNVMLEKNQSLIRNLKESLDNVAHDLRTPLTRMRGTAELALQDDKNTGAHEEALADCIEESDRVLEMLRSIMDVAEAEAGSMKLNRTETDLAGLAKQVIDTYEYVAEEKNVKLVNRFSQSCRANIDAVRIRQAIGNLVDNAIKYTPNGGLVEINGGTVGRDVEIRVRDTGVGIPELEQGCIFDRLYRGDKSRSEKGLGLGLSLVKAVVEAHGGTIRVQSRPDNGSEFVVEIPMLN